MSLFLSQDEGAGRISELSLSEDGSRASEIELFAIPEWDRMRTVSLTIGGPRPESLKDDESRGMANDSLLTLSLPIGSDTTSVYGYDGSGDKSVIMEDGFLVEG